MESFLLVRASLLFNGDGSSLSNPDIEGKVEDIVLQLSPMNKVTAKSFTIDSLARLEEKKFPVGESESKFNQINIINHGEDVAQIDAFVAKPKLDRVKDKDYINVNLTYELDKLTKGNQKLGSGEWSLIAESIDPQRCANLSSSITLRCRSSLLHTLS